LGITGSEGNEVGEAIISDDKRRQTVTDRKQKVDDLIRADFVVVPET